MSENDVIKLPEVVVFAGPNGSGKTTITSMAKIAGEYINADDIKRTTFCSDLEAAVKAEELREKMISEKKDFTFETVLSTDRNLNLLKKAKEQGYFVRGYFILTANVDVNIARVNVRVHSGGHGVPEDKIISRYRKSLDRVPELVNICDILHVYDNTSDKAFRIFKKRKDVFFKWSNEFWSDEEIDKLCGI